MKILIAIDHFCEGGAERVASLLVNQLCMDHDVHVVVMEKGINYPLDLKRIKLHMIEYNAMNKMVKVWTKLSELRKIVRKVNADVVFAFANVMSIYISTALIWNGKGRTRLISSERTDPTREPSKRITKMLRDWAYRRSDYLICQTPWVADYFKKRIKVACIVIPNPITPCLPVWQGEGSKVVMTACRLEEQKNLPMLINAFARLHKLHPDFRLIIHGEGSFRPILEEMIDNLGLCESVLLPGFSKQIHREMACSYMYVSSSNYEGISNSMLEALGIGIPTICTDCPVGGANMFIRNGENGLLVPVEDVDSLFSAMLRMVEDKDLAVKCSFNSRSINKKLNASHIAEQWINLIR